MSIENILTALEERRDDIEKAISALSGMRASGNRRGRTPGRRLSAAARKRISEAMKKRWAARKKAA